MANKTEFHVRSAWFKAADQIKVSSMLNKHRVTTWRSFLESERPSFCGAYLVTRKSFTDAGVDLETRWVIVPLSNGSITAEIHSIFNDLDAVAEIEKFWQGHLGLCPKCGEPTDSCKFHDNRLRIATVSEKDLADSVAILERQLASAKEKLADARATIAKLS